MNRIDITDRSGRAAAFEIAPGERILHAGLAAGLALPYECATGTCGSCRATIASGTAENLWEQAPGARNFRSAAEILMCQTTANSALSLTLRSNFGAEPRHLPRHAEGLMREAAKLLPDVSMFEVELVAPMPYQAGQFVIVSFDGLAGPRAYSMSSFAPGSTSLSLLIRRCGEGGASERLFDGEAAHGVRVFGPLGKAVFDPEEGRPFVAIAGGSGIAGMLAIVDCATQARHFERRPSHLYFGLRAPEHAYCLGELNRAAEASGGGLAITVAFSEGEAMPELASTFPALRFSQGFVHEAACAEPFAPPGDAIFFIAGPPPMVDASIKALLARKISPKDIRYDKFG
jgi:toluene monooxygenase electron transfer component